MFVDVEFVDRPVIDGFLPEIGNPDMPGRQEDVEGRFVRLGEGQDRDE